MVCIEFGAGKDDFGIADFIGQDVCIFPDIYRMPCAAVGAAGHPGECHGELCLVAAEMGLQVPCAAGLDLVRDACSCNSHCQGAQPVCKILVVECEHAQEHAPKRQRAERTYQKPLQEPDHRITEVDGIVITDILDVFGLDRYIALRPCKDLHAEPLTAHFLEFAVDECLCRFRETPHDKAYTFQATFYRMGTVRDKSVVGAAAGVTHYFMPLALRQSTKSRTRSS